MINRLLVFIPLISLSIACTGVTESLHSEADTSPIPSTTAVDVSARRVVSPDDLQFGGDSSTPVISKAQKFILPIPIIENGGEPLVYPVGDDQEGMPILDWQRNPIGDRGLVFFNQADQTVQAVAGDGEGVIIINEVTAEQANALHNYILTLNTNPAELTLDQLKAVIAFAQDELNLGDMYNSDRTFISENMSSIDTWTDTVSSDPLDPLYGLKKRDNRDINQAIYIPENFQFQGPAATPQVFENGGVIVQQNNSVRGIQPDVFLRTYSFSNGQPISTVTDLAIQEPF